MVLSEHSEHLKYAASNEPKISVITVVYNRVNTLEQAIKSVLDQQYTNVEYILIDGGSTDGSIDIIEKYADRINYHVSEPDKGMWDALNKGMERATGDLIAIVHSDDFLFKNNVLSTIAKAHEEAGADVYCGNALFYTTIDGNEIAEEKRADIDRILESHNSVVHPAMVIKREVFQQFGGYDLRYRFANDYEYLMRLVKSGCRFSHIDRVICGIRAARTGRVSNTCKGHLECYQFHKKYRTGNHTKYIRSYLTCASKRIIKKMLGQIGVKKYE